MLLCLEIDTVDYQCVQHTVLRKCFCVISLTDLTDMSCSFADFLLSMTCWLFPIIRQHITPLPRGPTYLLEWHLAAAGIFAGRYNSRLRKGPG